MSNTITFKNYFLDNNIPLEDVSDGDGTVFRTTQNLKSVGSVTVAYFFNENETILDIKIFGIATITNALKKENLYDLFNELNSIYRFITFYEFEGDINGTYSFILPPNEIEPGEIVELTISMMSTATDVYPKFMKVIWT